MSILDYGVVCCGVPPGTVPGKRQDVKQPHATKPPRVFKQRAVMAADQQAVMEESRKTKKCPM